MQGNNYGLLVKTIKNSQNQLFGQPDGFSLLTGTKFAVRLIELPFTLQHDREFVMFRFYLTIIPRGRVGYEMIDCQRGT